MNDRKTLLAVLVLSSTLATACSKKTTPTPTPTASASGPVVTVTTTPPDAGAADASAPHAALKNFFPPDGAGGYRRVIQSTARDGYAEAALEKDGKEVAVLSISDAERMAYTRAKFESATEKLDGYPLLTSGKDLSTILVKDRFQIKVLSKTLDAEQRKAILASFDLKGLGN
jgi:hypothetical protein